MPVHSARIRVFSVVLMLGLMLFVFACGEDEAASPIASDETVAEAEMEKSDDVAAEAREEKVAESMARSLPDKIVAPHFINSYPAHGDTLVQAPEVAVLNFNFNLHDRSSIAITRDRAAVSLGPLAIAEDQLSMRVPLEGPGDGVYEIVYEACWPDQTCHEGSTAFIVDGASIGEYQDLRGQSSVVVMLKDTSFQAPRIVISPGTTVTWENGDTAVHFVNTDPHPSHNVLVGLNSTPLEPGDTYEYTFEDPGAWGYHCSAHQNLGMIAQVVVK